MIGDLYNANNVKVGQAAVMIAPNLTPLPAISATVPVMSDPFSVAPWTQATVSASATITAGSYTLTYTYLGQAYTTGANLYNDPAATVAGRIVTALATWPGGGPTAAQVNVTGGPPSATTTPMFISLDEAFVGGTWTLTPTGITGGTLSITQPIWTPVGATDQGWTWASTKALQDITIEEQSTLVARLMTSQSITVTGALSEDIARTLATVFNMTSAFTAAATTNPAYTTLTLSDTVIQYAVAVIMANTFGPAPGYPRWLYIPSTTCLDNVTTPLRRAAAKRMYTAQFTSVCATSAIQVLEFNAPHT
jgi:hypothetical protein